MSIKRRMRSRIKHKIILIKNPMIRKGETNVLIHSLKVF
jgi:hypothetical protein